MGDLCPLGHVFVCPFLTWHYYKRILKRKSKKDSPKYEPDLKFPLLFFWSIGKFLGTLFAHYSHTKSKAKTDIDTVMYLSLIITESSLLIITYFEY